MRFIGLFAIVLAFTHCTLLEADDSRRVHTSRPNPRVLPLPKEEGVFHVVIYGDRTGGPKDGINVVKQAVKDTNLLAPDFVMTVGSTGTSRSRHLLPATTRRITRSTSARSGKIGICFSS